MNSSPASALEQAPLPADSAVLPANSAEFATESLAHAAAAPRPCPLCGRDNRNAAASRWSALPWILKQCGECDFLYLENPPLAERLVEDLAWEQTHIVERARRREREPWLVAINDLRTWFAARMIAARKGGKMLHWIDRYVRGGRLLDVGCGYGLLFELLPAGFQPFGVEVSRHMAEQADRLAQARGGYVVQGAASSAMSLFGSDFLDGIVMRSYLEHEAEPNKVLRVSRRILRPGGKLIVKVPNFACWNQRLRAERWCGFRFPDHVNYFTPASLVRMLEAHGFAVERFRFEDRLPTCDNMWLVARKPRN